MDEAPRVPSRRGTATSTEPSCTPTPDGRTSLLASAPAFLPSPDDDASSSCLLADPAARRTAAFGPLGCAVPEPRAMHPSKGGP